MDQIFDQKQASLSSVYKCHFGPYSFHRNHFRTVKEKVWEPLGHTLYTSGPTWQGERYRSRVSIFILLTLFDFYNLPSLDLFVSTKTNFFFTKGCQKVRVKGERRKERERENDRGDTNIRSRKRLEKKTGKGELKGTFCQTQREGNEERHQKENKSKEENKTDWEIKTYTLKLCAQGGTTEVGGGGGLFH